MMIFSWVVLIVCGVNLARMVFYLVGAEFYERWKSAVASDPAELPHVVILTPAFNEAKTIHRCLASVAGLNYPVERVMHLVINDGSTDDTSNVVRDFISDHPDRSIAILDIENGGKAAALNAGLRYIDAITSDQAELVMVLDSDSALDADALACAVRYFENPHTAMLSSHVRIIPERSIINYVQRVEYLIAYRMKRAQSVFATDYIVGGIGSMFRRSKLREVGDFDTNTVTEDIDLSMKVLERFGNRGGLCAYGADVITWTEACPTFRSLMLQRYRWKWGRCQTFLKRRSMFFSKSERHSKLMTWVFLPLEIVFDFFFLLEPFVVGFILSFVILYAEWTTILTAITTVSVYLIINIWREPYFDRSDRVVFALSAPLLYFLNYILSFAEYFAVLKTFFRLPALRRSLHSERTTWVPPERTGAKLSA